MKEVKGKRAGKEWTGHDRSDLLMELDVSVVFQEYTSQTSQVLVLNGG